MGQAEVILHDGRLRCLTSQGEDLLRIRRPLATGGHSQFYPHCLAWFFLYRARYREMLRDVVDDAHVSPVPAVGLSCWRDLYAKRVVRVAVGRSWEWNFGESGTKVFSDH